MPRTVSSPLSWLWSRSFKAVICPKQLEQEVKRRGWMNVTSRSFLASSLVNLVSRWAKGRVGVRLRCGGCRW